MDEIEFEGMMLPIRSSFPLITGPICARQSSSLHALTVLLDPDRGLLLRICSYELGRVSLLLSVEIETNKF